MKPSRRDLDLKKTISIHMYYSVNLYFDPPTPIQIHMYFSVNMYSEPPNMGLLVGSEFLFIVIFSFCDARGRCLVGP